MNPVTLALAILGMTGFALGAVVTAIGPFEMGVILMGLGLAFQVIALVRIKRERTLAAQKSEQKDSSNARG